MGYACKILADSISPAGHRLTSWEVTFPRIILAEVNTHCMLSRNSASSRARPVSDVKTKSGEIKSGTISTVRFDPFIPEVFGRNQKGMQPGEALEGDADRRARDTWRTAMDDALYHAERLAALEVHKQYANRLLEPFSWHTAVITATDVDNLFNLRVNPLAQGEFQKAVRLMKEARDASEPAEFISSGEWHLPYIEADEEGRLYDEGIPAWKVSVGRCARVSYLTQNGVRDPAEDVALADKLLESGHMSPFEHVARPMTDQELILTRAWDIALDDGPILRGRWGGVPLGEEIVLSDGKRARVTYVRGPLNYAGKLNGWISRRQFIRGEHDILGHRSARP